MPNSVILGLAKKSGKSEEDVEKLWKEAKVIAKKQYPEIDIESDQYFKIVTGILKKMLKLSEDVSTGDVDLPPTNSGPDSHISGSPCFKVPDDTFWKLHKTCRKDKSWYKTHYKDTRVADYARSNKGSTFYIQHEDNNLVRKISQKKRKRN